MSVDLCPSRAEDDEFLLRLYASTRAAEMELVNWTQPQKEAFLRMQFSAQRQHYQTYYPHAEYYTLQTDGQPIGRIILDRSRDPNLLIDIALLPEYRGQGIGTALMQRLMRESAGQNRAVMLHVEVFNPAMRLYERLGFIKTGELGLYQELTWNANQGAKAKYDQHCTG